MEELVVQFPNHLLDAINIAKKSKLTVSKNDIFSNVVLTGLGGSGIAGTIVQNYVFDKLNIPFVVNKEYFMPSFIGKDTLVIVSSYSGNTEETVQALHIAIQRKAKIVCITSGGQIAEIAKKKNIDLISLPVGMPPRACLGYGILMILSILEQTKLIKPTYKKEIAEAASLLMKKQKSIRQKSNNIAEQLHKKLPIIYSTNVYEGVAVRFKQQLNENSKIPAWHNVVPEMNHNELVGWTESAPDKVVVFFRDDSDYERSKLRMDINKKTIKKYVASVIDIKIIGADFWQKALYLIHLTDFISVDIARLKGIDPVEVKVIDALKNSLIQQV